MPHTRMGLLLPFVLALLLGLAGCSSPQDQETAIVNAALTPQGDHLYARFGLQHSLVKRIMEGLAQGSPISLTYRFRFRHLRRWLPDQTVAKGTIRRHIRLKLITRRYLMREMKPEIEFYSEDPDEAARFVGGPLYVPLIPLSVLKEGENYRLIITFQMEDEGVSKTFRALHRLLSFQAAEHQFILDHRYLPTPAKP